VPIALAGGKGVFVIGDQRANGLLVMLLQVMK
jgi:hypothetical protein